MSTAAIYKVTIRTDQVNEEGKSAVRIRIRKSGQTRYLQTGIFLKYHKDKRKSEWNDDAEEGKKNWVTSRHYDHGELNNRLATFLKRLRQIEEEHPGYSATQLRDAYGQPEEEPEEAPRAGFVAFMREWIRRKEKLEQHGQEESCTSYLKYFTRFWGKRPDDPALLTPSTVADLVHFLRTCDTKKGKGVGYEASTINTAMSMYRSFFRNAILEGYIPPAANPFQIPKLEEVERPVERPEVEQILGLQFLSDLPPRELHARNVFLMQFFLNGARVSEAYTLKWADVGADHIRYKPRKRATSLKVVPRHEGVDWVLDQYPRQGVYIFPYLSDADALVKGKERLKLYKRINKRVSTALEKLSQRAGILRLRSHMQRHTFADFVYQQTKDMHLLSGLLGHADIKTSQVYMKSMGHNELDALNRSLYTAAQGNVRERNAQTPANLKQNEDKGRQKKKPLTG